MLTGYGLARRIHIALIALLVIGVAGSFWMSVRARSTAEDRAVEQAQVIADSSLTLVFRPDDLQHDATSERIRELTRSIDDVVLDPSDFDTVTLFSGSGEILFSTEDGNIGQRFAGERARIRTAFRGEPQARLVDDTLSVLVGLRFPSGVGNTAAVELSRPADDITGAAAPWRTNMFFLGGALALVLLAAGAPMFRGSTSVDPSESAADARAGDPGTPGRRAGETDRGTAAGDEGRGGGSPARRDARTGSGATPEPLARPVPRHPRGAAVDAAGAARPADRAGSRIRGTCRQGGGRGEIARAAAPQRDRRARPDRRRAPGQAGRRRGSRPRRAEAGRSRGHGPAGGARRGADAALDDDPGTGRPPATGRALAGTPGGAGCRAARIAPRARRDGRDAAGAGRRPDRVGRRTRRAARAPNRRAARRRAHRRAPDRQGRARQHASVASCRAGRARGGARRAGSVGPGGVPGPGGRGGAASCRRAREHGEGIRGPGGRSGGRSGGSERARGGRRRRPRSCEIGI